MFIWNLRGLSIIIIRGAVRQIKKMAKKRTEKTTNEILVALDSLEDYDPTVLDASLTRFLIDTLVVCSGDTGWETHDIAHAVARAEEAFARVGIAPVTEERVRSALAALDRIGRVYLPPDRRDEFFVIPRSTRDESFDIRQFDRLDFLAVCDALDLNPETWDDEETEEKGLSEVDAFKTSRDTEGRGKYAIVGYPRPHVETYDNPLYPLVDQQCRICAVL